MLVYGGSLQYSMPYLKSEIKDLQLPDFINHLIPIVEAQFSTPVANNFGNSYVTTGTINPGVIWVGSYFQVGLEAMVPVNRASGTGVGFLGQLHLYLDDMFPTTIRPAAARRHADRSPQSSLLKETTPCERSITRHRTARGARVAPARSPTPFSTTPARWSAARSQPPRTKLTLSFTQNLEPAFSARRGTRPNGARVEQGKAQVSGNTMRVGLKAAGTGHLSRSLARALGRHAQDPGKLHLPRSAATDSSAGGRTEGMT